MKENLKTERLITQLKSLAGNRSKTPTVGQLWWESGKDLQLPELHLGNCQWSWSSIKFLLLKWLPRGFVLLSSFPKPEKQAQLVLTSSRLPKKMPRPNENLLLYWPMQQCFTAFMSSPPVAWSTAGQKEAQKGSVHLTHFKYSVMEDNKQVWGQTSSVHGEFTGPWLAESYCSLFLKALNS